MCSRFIEVSIEKLTYTEPNLVDTPAYVSPKFPSVNGISSITHVSAENKYTFTPYIWASMICLGYYKCG